MNRRTVGDLQAGVAAHAYLAVVVRCTDVQLCARIACCEGVAVPVVAFFGRFAPLRRIGLLVIEAYREILALYAAVLVQEQAHLDVALVFCYGEFACCMTYQLIRLVIYLHIPGVFAGKVDALVCLHLQFLACKQRAAESIIAVRVIYAHLISGYTIYGVPAQRPCAVTVVGGFQTGGVVLAGLDAEACPLHGFAGLIVVLVKGKYAPFFHAHRLCVHRIYGQCVAFYVMVGNVIALLVVCDYVIGLGRIFRCPCEGHHALAAGCL